MQKRQLGNHLDWTIVGIFGFALVMTVLCAVGLREVLSAALNVFTHGNPN